MPNALATLQQRMLDEIATLMGARAYLGPATWQAQFERMIIEYHAAAYFAGPGQHHALGARRCRAGAAAANADRLSGRLCGSSRRTQRGPGRRARGAVRGATARNL